MRLFRSSNKSQASLDQDTDSRDHSPIQTDSAYPQPQVYNSPPHLSQEDAGEKRYYRDNVQQPIHPVHVLDHPPPKRGPPGPIDVHAKDPLHQPTVNVVPPLSPITPIQQAHYIQQTQVTTLQSPTNRSDREKKPKRGFFGLGSRKEEKDQVGDRSRVHRTNSKLRKSSHQHPSSNPHSPHDVQVDHSAPSDLRLQALAQGASSENLPLNSTPYEQYYRPQSQYDNPHLADTPQLRYYRENTTELEQPSTPRHVRQASLHSQQSQRAGYQVYHQPSSANNSTTVLHQQLQTSVTNNPLRPPSQNSIGPPSPLVTGSLHNDSRPPTGDQPNRPPFYSVVSAQQVKDSIHQRQVSQDVIHLEPDDNMGRTDASNGNTRQHRDDDGRHPPPHYQPQQDPRIRTQSHDQGRNTPPPRFREELGALDYHQLMQKHEELLAKYSKVKRYYFEREAQVTQLQNTVANQRLSMSKTSLDDAQYTTRFDRLNGAIQNLAFNIRKEWRRIPNWLAPVCNRDACQTGTKEMTAVGRACITRWLFESLFERVFHPGIEPNLSYHLKNIERSLRRSEYGALLTNEAQDDLMTKIMTWRLTTVEGLEDVLASRQSDMYVESLTHNLTRQLNEYVKFFLTEPPPPGVYDSIFSIVAQAVGICSNIPRESRDIRIDYFMPGYHVNEIYMKLEPGMTALQHPGSAPSATDIIPGVNAGDDDQMSTTSSVNEQDLEAKIRENTAKGTSPNPAGMQSRTDSMSSGLKNPMQPLAQSSDKNSSRDPKKGIFGGFVNKKPAPGSASNPSSAGIGLSLQQSDSSKPADGDSGPDSYNIQTLTGGSTEGKIRFAVFLAIEVKGRSTLSKEIEKTKDSDKLSTHGTDSAGPGQQASENTGSGNSKNEKASMNVLVKAPVYAFE